MTDCRGQPNELSSMRADKFTIIDSRAKSISKSFANPLIEEWPSGCAPFMSDEAPPVALIGAAYLQAFGSVVFDNHSLWISMGNGSLPVPKYNSIAVAKAVEKPEFWPTADPSAEVAQRGALEGCSKAYGTCKNADFIDGSEFMCLAVVVSKDGKIFIGKGRSSDSSEVDGVLNCHNRGNNILAIPCEVKFHQCNRY